MSVMASSAAGELARGELHPAKPLRQRCRNLTVVGVAMRCQVVNLSCGNNLQRDLPVDSESTPRLSPLTSLVDAKLSQIAARPEGGVSVVIEDQSLTTKPEASHERLFQTSK
jgi:hypothetical protein